MREYKDSCTSLEVLKQDSGLLPKPVDNWNTFEPAEGDYAKVGEQDYQFTNGEWVETDSEITADLDEASTHAGAWFEAAYPNASPIYKGRSINPHRERAKQLKETKNAGTSV